MEWHVVEFECYEGYHLNDLDANVRFECNLGEVWTPGELPTCIKGTKNVYFASVIC